MRGPKHVVKKGKTPVLSAEEARGLLDRIDLSTLAGLRDRAMIGVLVFSFARVSAAVSMRVPDYYTQGKRSFFRLHEKGGRYNVVPAHHLAQEYVDAYLEAAELGEDRKGPLFRSCAVGRQDRLEDRAMTRATALRMIKRWRSRGGCADRRPRVNAHHPALQPGQRRDLARRDRAYPHLSEEAEKGTGGEFMLENYIPEYAAVGETRHYGNNLWGVDFGHKILYDGSATTQKTGREPGLEWPRETLGGAREMLSSPSYFEVLGNLVDQATISQNLLNGRDAGVDGDEPDEARHVNEMRAQSRQTWSCLRKTEPPARPSEAGCPLTRSGASGR